MATNAQILANRENAQHSTGPTTEAGKANSSQNATRHALTSRGLIVPLGLESAFMHFDAALRVSLVPNGSFQEIIFQRILECGWNLERCRRAQAQLFEQSTDLAIDPLLDDQNEAKLARIDKYARQYENSMFKAMRELGKLQTEAQYRLEIRPLTQEEIDDPDRCDRAPQILSAVCNYQKAMAAAGSSAKTGRALNKAESTRAAMELLDQLTTPSPMLMPNPALSAPPH